jgi:transducin (beta)-like 1
MSVSQEEVNFLVWRYLIENGFEHSAFLFESEAYVDVSHPFQSQLGPGALPTILQQSLEYLTNEKFITETRSNPEHPQASRLSDLEAQFTEIEQPPEPELPPFQDLANTGPILLSPAVATVLASHRSSVFCCRWSDSRLATAGSDGTLVIWAMDGPTLQNQVILPVPADSGPMDHDITCLDWSPSGSILACGSCDSHVRLYAPDGRLLTTLTGHTHTVYSVKFSPTGDYLATGSADQTAILWKMGNFQNLQTFRLHTDTIVDIAWQSPYEFATASADNSIGLCSQTGPLMKLNGHTDHVNALVWSASGTFLASGSDDTTVRIWEGSTFRLLNGHDAAVSAVQWMPQSDKIVISGAVDGAVRLWDAEDAQCLRVVQHHQQSLLALAASPSGEYLASGSSDQTVAVSRARDGEIIAVFRGNSQVYDVAWDPSGAFLAAAFDDAIVVVIEAAPYLR